MFSITGSTMKQAMSPDAEHPLEGVEVVVRHDHRGGDDVGRDALGAGHRVRRVGRAGELERRLHRDHHLVVMTVIAALDLGDAVATGRPRARRMASIVASVPEFVNRHIGSR